MSIDQLENYRYIYISYDIVCTHRHPSREKRPRFRNILMILLEKEEVILSIPSDLGGSSQAAVLGAPVEAGFDMYAELQTKYQVELVWILVQNMVLCIAIVYVYIVCP